MHTMLLVLLIAHIVLYLAWKMTAIEEKQARKDGKKIPIYATGGLGNLIGFSLVTVGVAMLDPLPSSMLIVSACIFSSVATIALHYYWKITARGKTVSLYLPDGSATVAGLLHLPYVLFIATVISTFLFHSILTMTLEFLPSISVVIGLSMYGIAIIIDKKRKVI